MSFRLHEEGRGRYLGADLPLELGHGDIMQHDAPVVIAYSP